MAKTQLKKKILLVEDEPDLRQFVAWVLEAEGYTIIEAGDSTEGLILARQQMPNMILLDLRLPTNSGWTLLENIKKSPATARIPVVLFTASAEASQRSKAQAMGAVDYLVKPVSANELKECCRRHELKQPPEDG
jgi:two-component system phosphate regulon response regulator PhoB